MSDTISPPRQLLIGMQFLFLSDFFHRDYAGVTLRDLTWEHPHNTAPIRASTPKPQRPIH